VDSHLYRADLLLWRLRQLGLRLLRFLRRMWRLRWMLWRRMWWMRKLRRLRFVRLQQFLRRLLLRCDFPVNSFARHCICHFSVLK
jgi:hypothetical protein